MSNSYQFTYPAQDANGLYGLIPKMYAGGTMPVTTGLFFLRTGAAGFRQDGYEQGDQKQYILRSDIGRGISIKQGQKPIGQRGGNVELLRARSDDWVFNGRTYGYKEMRDTPAYLQTMATDGQMDRQAVEKTFDRRLSAAFALTCRTAAQTEAVSGSTRFVHAGGTVVRRSGGTSVVADALNNAYPLTAAGGLNVLNDVRSLRERMENKGIDPRECELYLHTQLHQALQYLEGESRTTVYSRDFEGTQGNSVNNAMVTRLQGFRLARVGHLDRHGLYSQGGIFPSYDLSNPNFIGDNQEWDGLPASLRANFAPATGTGMPVAYVTAKVQASTLAPVHYFISQDITPVSIDKPDEHCLFQSVEMDVTIHAVNPQGAGSLEITAA